VPAKRIQNFRAPITLLLGVSAWLERHPGETATDFYVSAVREKLSRDGIKTTALLPK
jgi:hypothetical protein